MCVSLGHLVYKDLGTKTGATAFRLMYPTFQRRNLFAKERAEEIKLEKPQAQGEFCPITIKKKKIKKYTPCLPAVCLDARNINYLPQSELDLLRVC